VLESFAENLLLQNVLLEDQLRRSGLSPNVSTETKPDASSRSPKPDASSVVHLFKSSDARPSPKTSDESDSPTGD
jgi:hypothetical protein